MGRRGGIARAGATVAVAIMLAGCGGDSSMGDRSFDGDGTRIILSVDQRKEAVDLKGTTLEGDRLDIATLRGKPVVLNVWGSWCPPCRQEAPDLEAAATQLKGKAAFVGIAVRDDAGSAQAYQRTFKISYPSLLDDGDLLLSLRGAVASQSPPVTLVLDAQGRVAARFVGPVTTRTLVGMVSDVSAA